MPGKLFVSYRRDDERAVAARVRDRLVAEFGADNVFMDVDNLMAGQRFDKELEKALLNTDVFVTVIGSRWMEHFGARLKLGERDYVHEEIAAALKRGVVVIPLLVEQTPLPRAEDLPADIRELVLHQKHNVRHEHFGHDMSRLLEAIKFVRAAVAESKVTAPVRQARTAAKVAAGLALLLGTAGAGAYFAGVQLPWVHGSSGTSTAAKVGLAEISGPDAAARRDAEAKAKAAEASRQADAEAAARARADEERQRAEAQARRVAELEAQRQVEADARREAEAEIKRMTAAAAALKREQEAREAALAASIAAEARRLALEQFRRQEEESRLAEQQRRAEVARRQAEDLAAEQLRQSRIAMDEQKAEALRRNLQIELARVGCDPGNQDGKWGDNARMALLNFVRRTQARVQADPPTEDALAALRAHRGLACPLQCAADEVESNGRCVPQRKPVAKPTPTPSTTTTRRRVKCNAGEVEINGRCLQRKRPQTVREERQTERPERTSSSRSSRSTRLPTECPATAGGGITVRIAKGCFTFR